MDIFKQHLEWEKRGLLGPTQKTTTTTPPPPKKKQAVGSVRDCDTEEQGGEA